MANLKDIDYGIGKYLVASDASGVPAIGANRKNLDLLNFKVATNNAYALYNFKDGMIDAYEDTSGVNSGSSSNDTRDSSGKYYSGFTNVVAGFTTVESTTWTAPAGVTTAEILVVAGGGGASAGNAGGGGAGGVVHHATYPITASVVYDLTVGAGGAGRGVDLGYSGSNSSFNNNNEGSQSKMTALGGGGAAYYYGPGGQDPAGDGGSGGGGAYQSRPGGSATQGDSGGGTGYGNDGGDGVASTTAECGCGGGGASAVGAVNPEDDAGGVGGAGREFSNFGAYGTNSSNDSGATPGSGSGKGYFAGGGAGSALNPSPQAAGGVGGGAAGQAATGTAPSGYANSGGGGGGIKGPGGSTGGSGGTGVVLVRYSTYNNMTLVSNTQTANAEPDEGRLMIYEEASTGSITLDTDLKGYVSRDGGTTYTQTPLTLDTTYETGKTLVSGSVDISGQPSGTSMRYKIETLNQSSSKVCRLHGASLLWA